MNTTRRTSIFKDIEASPEHQFNIAVSEILVKSNVMIISRRITDGHMELAVLQAVSGGEGDLKKAKEALQEELKVVSDSFGFSIRLALWPAYMESIIPGNETQILH